MIAQKDFKAIAEIVKEETSHINPHFPFVYVKFLTEKLADYFATQNSRFDRERFFKACGL